MVGKYFGAGYWRSKYGMQIFTRQISRKRRLQRAISICMALGFQNFSVNYYVICTNSQCLIIVSRIFNVCLKTILCDYFTNIQKCNFFRLNKSPFANVKHKN